jgi:hypothetical protein
LVLERPFGKESGGVNDVNAEKEGRKGNLRVEKGEEEVKANGRDG